MSKEREKGDWRLALSAVALVGSLKLGDYQKGPERLVIPPVSSNVSETLGAFGVEPFQVGEGVYSIGQEDPLTKTDQIDKKPEPEANVDKPCLIEEPQGPIVYVVKEGDSLSKISQEHNNLPVEIIYNMNSQVIGDNPDLIRPGQELLLVRWNSVDASRHLASRRAQEVAKKGEMLDWVYFTLTSELSANEVADFFGISAEGIASLNEIDDPNIKLPKDYYLMLPIDEGFAFTETDREEGRRWRPMPGISLGAIWWESPTGEKDVEPSYPNIAYTVIPCPIESWVDATWSTADNLPADQFLPEEITNIPANRVWEIVDEEGNKTSKMKEGFLVHGKQKITHTGYQKVEAGEWVLPE